MKNMSKVQEESNQQMNKGGPAPLYTEKWNPLTKTDCSKPKAHYLTHLHCLLSTQPGAAAFWCTLGACLGNLQSRLSTIQLVIQRLCEQTWLLLYKLASVEWLINRGLTLLISLAARLQYQSRGWDSKPSPSFLSLVYENHLMFYHPAHPTVPQSGHSDCVKRVSINLWAFLISLQLKGVTAGREQLTPE